MTERHAMLSVTDVRKMYDNIEALAGVSLAADPGEIVALLGPNGAGKSTLVSIVAGLLRPDDGFVHVGGIDVAERPQQVRGILGLVPQELGIFPSVSVRENLVLMGELYGLRRGDLAARIDEIAGALLLEPLLAREARALSGGEKRRLHTAMALLHSPPLLLLDEPTVGADIDTRRSLLDLVAKLAAEGTAVLYSTHYMHEVETLDASVVILESGSVVATGHVGELVAAYGASGVELNFDGAAPELAPEFVIEGASITVERSTLRIMHPAPETALARLLAVLDADQSRLRSVNMFESNLESAYLSLTGRHYDTEGTDAGP